SAGQDEASRLTLTIRVGGSTDSDETDVTVMPVISLPRPAVMTLTPPARWRMAPRKSSDETSRTTLKLRTKEFMNGLTPRKYYPTVGVRAGSSPPARRDRPIRGGADGRCRYGCRGRCGPVRSPARDRPRRQPPRHHGS